MGWPGRAGEDGWVPSFGGCRQDPPAFSQSAAAAAALEQGDAQTLFQCTHLLAERRLGDEHARRCSLEVQFLRQHEEQTQLVRARLSDVSAMCVSGGHGVQAIELRSMPLGFIRGEILQVV